MNGKTARKLRKAAHEIATSPQGKFTDITTAKAYRLLKQRFREFKREGK